jgi:ferredoxin
MAKEITVQSIYFSPTGTTRRILSTMEEHIGLPLSTNIDLTFPKERDAFTGKVQGDILLVGLPVYGGSPPLPMLEPLSRIEGGGKWAIPVAVYGNRSADTCVEEMAKILRKRGFKILAGASFVAEHSFATKSHPWAVGRPDQSDLEIAGRFGKQIRKKLSLNPSEIQTSGLLHNFFSREMVESFPDGYYKRVIDFSKALCKVVLSEEAKCTDCMKCADVCPTGAIKIDSREINDGLCIVCAACTRACPEDVLSLRYVESPSSRVFFEMADKIFAVRKEPMIYI